MVTVTRNILKSAVVVTHQFTRLVFLHSLNTCIMLNVSQFEETWNKSGYFDTYAYYIKHSVYILNVSMGFS